MEQKEENKFSEEIEKIKNKKTDLKNYLKGFSKVFKIHTEKRKHHYYQNYLINLMMRYTKPQNYKIKL